MPKLIDHAERRRELAEAVWRVIGREGVGAVSVRTVAAEAGVSTGSLRHVLPTKGELLAAALELVIERSGARFIAELPTLNTRDDAIGTIGLMLPLDAERRLEMQVHLALVVESAGHPALAALQQQPYDALRAGCAAVLHACNEAGLLRSGLDLEHEAAALHVVVDGLAFHVVSSPTASPEGAVELLRRHLARLWADGEVA